MGFLPIQSPEKEDELLYPEDAHVNIAFIVRSNMFLHDRDKINRYEAA